MLHVGVDGLMLINNTPDLVADGTLPRLPHPLLDGVLEVVIEFHAAAGEELDAVVRHVIVGGRDHHAEIRAVLAHQVGGCGRGDHAHPQHVHACAGQPGADRGLQDLPRGAWVACHEGRRLAPPEHPGLAEGMGSRHRQVESQFSGQFLIRDASHAVSSEESSHGSKLRG